MAKKETKMQQARVLGGFTLDNVVYQPNDIIEAPAEIISAMGPSVDTDADAVAHCLAQEGALPRRHPVAAEPEATPAAAPAPTEPSAQ